MLIYIKKLASLNPTQFRTMELKEALEWYHEYCQACMRSPYPTKPEDLKTFEEWRRTEI